MYLYFILYENAIAACAKITTNYGCPICLGNGYRMERWGEPLEINGVWYVRKPWVTINGIAPDAAMSHIKHDGIVNELPEAIE